MLTSYSLLQACVVDLHDQIITLKLQRGDCSWYYSIVYASPTPSMRQSLWLYIMELCEKVDDPWLLLGDFNEILYPSEVRGGCF